MKHMILLCSADTMNIHIFFEDSSNEDIDYKEYLKTSDISIVRPMGFLDLNRNNERLVMLVDENGYQKNLKVNTLASLLYDLKGLHKILGDVLIVKEVEINYEYELRTLEKSEVMKVISILHKLDDGEMKNENIF